MFNLVNQLPEEQQKALLQRLMKRAGEQTLTTDEKLALHHNSITKNPVNEPPTVRSEDWYDDDG